MVKHGKKPSSGARLLKALMGLFLVVAGASFMGLLWHSYQRAQQTRQWIAVPAMVVLSEVVSEKPSVNSPLAHRPVVRYHYEYEGSKYTGNHVKRVEGPSSNRSKADEVVKRYRVGQKVTCYLNPQQPDFAILEHETKAGLYSIWFPFLFVVGGGGMIWAAFRHRGDP